MISISSPLKQDDIVKLLDGYSEDGVTLKFVKKEGLKLLFETTGEPEASAKMAKKAIKATPWGGVLYFQAAVA